MRQLEHSLRELAGRSFKIFLRNLSGHPFLAVLGGMLVTGILQSSSVTNLMILSFVGAGIVSMKLALAIVLGANIGSTFLSWIIAGAGFRMGMENFAFPLLAVALPIFIFTDPRRRLYEIAGILIGLAFLFIGLEWIKQGALSLTPFININASASWSPYLMIPAGILITSVVQSSSATMAISMSNLHYGVSSFEAAACLIIGSELGGSTKLFIGSAGGTPDKKRVALGNFLFNAITVILATAFLHFIIYTLQRFYTFEGNMFKLAAFQSLINIGSAIISLPLLGAIANYLKGRYIKEETPMVTRFIRPGQENFSSEMISLATLECAHLLNHGIHFCRQSLRLEPAVPASGWEKLKESLGGVMNYNEEYQKLKQLEGSILDYLAGTGLHPIRPAELNKIGTLVTVVRDVIHGAKNIKDITHNLNEFATTSNDYLHRHFQESLAAEKEFYHGLESLNQIQGSAVFSDKCDSLNAANHQMHENGLNAVMDLLRQKKITELDASSLLNVHREIHSSNKALLQAMTEIHLLR